MTAILAFFVRGWIIPLLQVFFTFQTVGEINGACCHCSELAGKIPVIPTIWETRSLFLPLQSLQRDKRPRGEPLSLPSTRPGKNHSKGRGVRPPSHSWGAQAGSQSLQGPAGYQRWRTYYVFLVEGQDRSVNTAAAGRRDCFRARPEREKGGAIMARACHFNTIYIFIS